MRRVRFGHVVLPSLLLFFVPDADVQPTAKAAQSQLRIGRAFVQRGTYTQEHGLEMDVRIVCFRRWDIHPL
jgi:hypothetical protein